uniref:ATP synthase F0 subunit 8 n=1 Tax=Ogadenus brumpti TaxID=1827023 RepID=A0A1P8AG02_9ACAR|nr:ATP synthase F0 subunit 8 [Ogadenus brumpti]AMX74043.1 ATP synthase F0 subunit 8 [Ogadenus brumpti]AMX74056.1 ATP synthase F0 subunit 8 [Ogadenus brumpti]
MPQLFPMNWLFLTLAFLVILYMVFLTIYHSPLLKIKTNLSSYTKLTKSWKW